jgi:hypothetical protein
MDALPNQIMCPGCGHLNADADHFCAQCAAPLTSHAATDPMGSIFAQGYAIGRGVNQPKHLIVVVGLWLIALPMLVFIAQYFPYVLGELVLGLLQLQPGQILAGLVGVALMVLFLAIYGGIVFKTTRNYLRGPENEKSMASTAISAKPMHTEADGQSCLACGQRISANEEQCPACGWSWDTTE